MIVSEIATQVRERVPVSEIRGEDYISTDNMRPNFCGIEPSLSVPPTGTVTAYKAGDILLSNIRPYFRKTWLATHDGGCNADVLCIRANSPKCIPKYLYYLFTTDNFVNDYLKSCKGAKMPRGDVNRLLAFEFHLPDRPTQLRIAGILGSLDEKIEVNRRKIAELEALTKTIYDYWFVQFDFPDAHGRPYKTSGGAMEWKKELKREIPKGWRIGTINDLGEIVSGGTPSTHNPDFWTTNGIAWITPKDLSNTSNKYIRHGEHDITDAGLHGSSAQMMPRRSIILSTRAPIGYLAVADCDLCTNQGIKSIIPNKGIGSEFIYYSVQTLIPYIKTFGGGSTFAEISKSEYSSLQVVLPQQAIIDKFVDAVTPIAEARRISEIAIEETIQIRDTLLPLLMNGQVNVAG